MLAYTPVIQVAQCCTVAKMDCRVLTAIRKAPDVAMCLATPVDVESDDDGPFVFVANRARYWLALTLRDDNVRSRYARLTVIHRRRRRL